jgi:soluble lytic murein transglycosylase
MTLVRLFAILLALASPPLAAAPGDDDFLAMRDAFRMRDQRKLDALLPRLKGHVLEPYAAYWHLRNQLDSATPEAVRAVLSEYKDTFAADRLRADWLKLLGKNQQWELFEAERPALVEQDAEITCLTLQSRARSDATAVREARALWFTERDSPQACWPLFAQLAGSGQITVQEVWTRVRWALAAGQVGVATRAGALLPAGQQPNSAVLAAVLKNSAGQLARPFEATSKSARETQMFAAYRLARSSPRQAATHWAAMEQRFLPDERSFVWGQIGLQGMYNVDPEAVHWFTRGGDPKPFEHTDTTLEWRARAALRAGDWKMLLGAVEVMEKEQHDSPWRYWKARALKALGRDAEAMALLKPLAQEHHFYGQLALEDMGGKITVPPVGYNPTATDVQAMMQTPGIRRALALFVLGLRFEGHREWAFTIRDMDDRKLIAAAEVARRHNMPDRAINTADKTATLHDFRLRYLTPHRDLVKAHSTQTGLDEAWVLGLIRQESRFITEARSSAGAMGLMQLMPGTARWVAGKLGVKDSRWSAVIDPDTNIQFGTFYLRHVQDFLDGNAMLATAAYNAGPGRARQWRPERTLDAAVWAENIPFNETRHYVKLVMANASYYAGLLTQQAQSLRARIGQVGPAVNERPLGDTP